ncbi:hypothetical protein BASA50_008949 [Batrachochytrium salamandrivorans]|uniref:Reverse transcriptase domain-containing protein n=1 Tax=Batrachochytrium salamandrivorans TaxID=1357716 RepID=A0ABQ8F2D3_9FUNG|nr:hypothetical protein BASA50_008949 [Batrachochytrium salamandrivorans]
MTHQFEDQNSLKLFELLGQMLGQFTSMDNQERAAAEDQFHQHWLVNQTDVTFAGLAHLAARHPSEEIRSMAAVLLRRKGLKFVTDDKGAGDVPYFATLGEEVRGYIHSQLLLALTNENVPSIRNKICDTTAELAAYMCSMGAIWTELVQATASFVQSPDAKHRQSAFNIIRGAPDLFCNEEDSSSLAILNAGIQDPDESVRLAALRAGSAFLVNATPSTRQTLTSIVPQMLNVLPPILGDPTKDVAATQALESLGELAAECSSVFHSTIPALIEFMTSIMRNTTLENAVRHSALELLLTLAETSRAVMRKNTTYALSVIPILVEWMSEHDDDDDWYTTEDLDDLDQDSNETVGEQSMDRVARNLGGKIVLPIAFNIIPSYLGSPEWPKRHAALRCISAIGEGCIKLMTAELEKVVGLVIPHLADPHPRVRHAACNAIGQMCTDFAPKIQDKYYDVILTHLVPVMDDVQHPRVQTYAAAALVNFAEQAKKECISPYLELIIPKLLSLLDSGKMFSKEQAITSLATIADSAGDQFSQFYPSIMSVLMRILNLDDSLELRSLVGKTLECSSLVVMACGKEVFVSNAEAYIQVLQKIQSTAVDSDDPRTSYLLGAWARVCKVLGHDFAPFLGIVLPPLFVTAKHVPQFAVLDADDEEPSEEDGWEVMQAGSQKMAIKTSYLEDKCTAVEMLVCYVKELGPLYHPHVQETVALVLPMLGFYFHEGVRMAAFSVIPLLLQSWLKADYPKEKIISLWNEVAVALISTLKKDNESQIISQVYDTFHDSLSILGPMILSEAFLVSLITETLEQLKTCKERYTERAALRLSEEQDQEDEEELDEEEEADDTLLQSIGNAIHELFKAYGAHFLPYFNQLVPAIDACMVSQYHSERRLALDVYQEMVEFTPAESVKYQPHFLKFMVDAILDEVPHVRQTAAFGIGAAALSTGDFYRDVCISSLQKLHTVITAPECRSDDNVYATENAISAIGKICQRYGASGAFDLNQVLPIWLQSLPIVEDSEEFGPTYTYLLELVDACHPMILPSQANGSAAGPHLAKIVDIFTQVLALPGIVGLDGLFERMLATLRRLLSQCSDETGSQWVADPVQCSTLRDEWSRLKAAATQLERVDGRKQWVKHADNLDRAVSDGRTDLVFSAARAMSGNGSRSAAVTPLYNSDGIVQYDPTSILRVMQCHYGSLAADTTGHSLDLQYWHDRQPIQASPNTPPIRNSDILDQDFSWNQIAAALLQMSPRKAPGDDGITTAFYQAALYTPANTQEGVPPTPFSRALLRVCGQVFASATIPRAWLCASIVSIDKKDGDPLNPGDKRGIALINVGLKLVCKVLQMRIERFVETNNLLSYEQAGFRKREECVGQVVSLVDIIQRRQNAGLNTHVLFIDIRKAFDTVPVGALLWKLQNMGFPRRTLAFLKALYTSSSARARAGSLLSDPFPVQRGVRQGCPLSGLLFNLFINDILDGVAPITVPGLSRDTNPIRGLMYADDVAVFADSEQSLLAASTAIEQWANQWEMQFGVAKCGIISFTGHLAPRLDNPLDIRLHGQLVSRVESYKYLGVLIDSKLDHSAWLKQKRSALEHTISALHPVLANHQLTVNYRSRIFSAVVMGKAYYGLELVGGNKSHLAPLQTTINKGIRLFTGARLSTAIGPLLVETGIGSLLTRSLVSRVRLLERSVTKRTPINAICSAIQEQILADTTVRPKTVKQRHSFALMETLRTCGDSASLQKYVTRQLLDTSGFFKDPSFDQSRAHGTRYLMLARMDALWTARKAIQIGILVDTHPFSVDRCILCDQQLLSTSIAHLVVECEQVTGHRIQSGLVPAIQKSRLRLLGRALDPGVENVYTWLRGGVLNGEADLDQRWLDGTVEHESMGTRHDNRALAARLADFLQVAYRQYQSTLWKYHRDRLVEVG